MPIEKTEKKAEDLICLLTRLEKPQISKVNTELIKYLALPVDDDQFETIKKIIHEKLGEARFDLYLKLTPKYISGFKNAEKNNLLKRRLHSTMKEEVTAALDLLDADIVHALNILRDNIVPIKAWLADKDLERFYLRAKLGYTYIALRMMKNDIQEFEKLLMATMEYNQDVKYNLQTGKLMPDVLLAKNPYMQLRKLGYFHHKEAEAAKSYSAKLAELQTKYDNATTDNVNLRADITSRKAFQVNMEKTLEEQKKEIGILNQKLKAAEDRLEYETHKFNEDSKAFKTVYAQNLTNRLAVEIEGMNVTLSDVGEPEKSKLLRRITNIERVLSEESV